jgi:hypothetical protein
MRRRSLSVLALALVGVVAIACGGSGEANGSTDGGDSGASIDSARESSAGDVLVSDVGERGDERPDDASASAACTDLAGALCTRIAACAPFLVGRDFVDDADCCVRATLACMQRMALSDSYPPLDVAADCTKQLASIACDAFFARGVHGFDAIIDYPCPVIGGVRDAGRRCVADAQCASGYCAYRWTGCGYCQPAPVDGAAPTDGYECGPWLVLGDDKRCHAPGQTGATCDTNAPCADDLYCVIGNCAVGGSLGDACDDMHPCDWTHGLMCDATSGKCAAVSLAKAGAPCDESAGFFTLRGEWCTGGTACVAAGAKKTCVKRIADGATCGATSPPCTGPSDCIGGVCVVGSDVNCK